MWIHLTWREVKQLQTLKEYRLARYFSGIPVFLNFWLQLELTHKSPHFYMDKMNDYL